MKGAVLYLDDRRQAVARNRGNGYDAKGNMTKDGPKRFVAAGVDGGASAASCSRGRRPRPSPTTCYVCIEGHGAGWLPLMVHVSGPGTNQALELYTHGPDLSGTIRGRGRA